MGSALRAQTTRYVPGQYATIQAAINASQSGDTILVAPGTYTENINYGSKRLVVSTDGTGDELVLQPANASVPVVTIPWVAGRTRSNTQLVGFKVQGGRWNSGAGLWIDGTCTVDTCIITNNGMSSTVSSSGGGGIYVSPNAAETVGPLIKNCQITNNLAGVGAGIYARCGQVSIIGCTITGNTAGWAGGGVYLWTRRLGRNEIKQCTISWNQAPTGNATQSTGGGVMLYEEAVDLESNLIQGNTARFGGGIGLIRAGNTRIVSNTILGNTAGGAAGPPPPAGGGIYAIDSSTVLTIERNWIRDNVANDGANSGRGGGVYLITQGTSPSQQGIKVQNNFLYKNLAGNYGGGISLHNTYCFLLSNSIAGNSTAWNQTYPTANMGAGLYVAHPNNPGSRRVVLGNCIVWANAGYQNGNILEQGASAIEAYSCNVQGGKNGWQGSTAVNLMDVDPLYANPWTGDLHLQSGSPMLDRGAWYAGVWVATPADDFDGQQRPIPSTAQSPDIGADERQ